MLLLGVVQHQAELDPLAGELAVGERAQPGQHHGQALLVAVSGQCRARRADRLPVADHLLQIAHQQVGRRREIGAAPVAVAAGAGVARGIVAGRPLSLAGAGAVQVLAPEQELDGVIAAADIGLDLVDLVQRAQQRRIDGAGIDVLAADGELRDWRSRWRRRTRSRRCCRRRTRRPHSRSGPRRAARRSPCPPTRRRSGCRSGTPRSAGRARAPPATPRAPRPTWRRSASASRASTAASSFWALRQGVAVHRLRDVGVGRRAPPAAPAGRRRAAGACRHGERQQGRDENRASHGGCSSNDEAYRQTLRKGVTHTQNAKCIDLNKE